MVRKSLSDDASRRLLKLYGGLAQLGEHLLCKQGVVGSIPSSSTTDLGVVVKAKYSGVFLSVCLWLLPTSIARLFFNNMGCSKGVVKP